MAKIVLGMATSHGPMLSTPPQQWGQRVVADKASNAHYFQGQTYTYDELAALRAGEGLAEQITQEVWQNRHAACRRALLEMSLVFDRVKPDVAVIFGNDQMEQFTDESIPALAVYWGETIPNQLYGEDLIARMPPGISISIPGHIPPKGANYQGHPLLGKHIISSVVKDGFDVTALRRFPVAHQTVPHAFGFVYRQLMSDRVIPSVPIFTNTFYPPNQPTGGRCRAFGQSVLRAVQSWPDDIRVALISSGGLSHFVIDEVLDGVVLQAIRDRDVSRLESLDESFFQSGSSEIKNWIPLIGAMAELRWPATVVDYVPCYRSEAGTGNAMGFVHWTPEDEQ